MMNQQEEKAESVKEGEPYGIPSHDLSEQVNVKIKHQNGDDLFEEESEFEENSKLIPFLLRCLVYSIHSLLQIIVLAILCIGFLLLPCYAKNVTWYCQIAYFFLCYLSVIQNIYCVFVLSEEDQDLFLFQKDGLFFYFTSLIIVTYLRTCKSKIRNFCDGINVLESRFINSVMFQDENETLNFNLDYETKVVKLPTSSITKCFKYFSSTPLNDDDTLQQDTFSLVKDFTSVQFQWGYVLILLAVEFIKILMTFLFLYKQGYQFSLIQDVLLISILMVYIITTLTFVQLLGNNDLQRKYQANRQLNSYIDFSDISSDTLKNKIDITCPISMETWDNIRKEVLVHEIKDIHEYELCYFCLLFYFIFSIVVCLSSYFELYWIISSDSHLLLPLNVIMNTFTFAFLSLFFLFRFYEGYLLNLTFDDFEMSIDNLIDTIEDLLTMYPDLFTNNIDHRMVNIESLQESTHFYIIKKIKTQSNYYINNQIQFLEKVYHSDDKNHLRINMIRNIKATLLKVRKSIKTDSKVYKYRFLNAIEVDFYSILTTIIIALVTTLPTIAPKFISFYTNIQPKQQ